MMPGLRLRGLEPSLAYDVKITDSALLDAEQYVNYIRFEKRDPEAAEIWFHGLVSAMFSLAQLPSRYALIPEADEFSFELRQLIISLAPHHLSHR